MFEKLVAIEPIRLPPQWEAKLQDYARAVELYRDIPADNAEIIRRIGDADAVMVSFTSTIDKEVLSACPNVKYIGMCCSLYAPENANVDILYARERGITVLGVRDYGDEGVGEYVISELVRLLHGFGDVMWKDAPTEMTGLCVGVLGMGTVGKLVARVLRFFGADVYYYSRTRKTDLEEREGYTYLPLDALLGKVEILCTCLNKNVVLLGEREFELYGNGKILLNASIAPSHEIPALEKWLARPGNYFLTDTVPGLDPSGKMLGLPNVLCVRQSAGMTSLAGERLGKKVMENIEQYFCTH